MFKIFVYVVSWQTRFSCHQQVKQSLYIPNHRINKTVYSDGEVWYRQKKDGLLVSMFIDEWTILIDV